MNQDLIAELKKQLEELEREKQRLLASTFNPSTGTTVEIPDAMKPIFQKAQEEVHSYFRHIITDPSKGTIDIDGERYILIRASALSTSFMDMIMKVYADRGSEEAYAIGHSFLFDIAHTIGVSDARAFHRRMGLKEPIEKLSVGPVHFAYTGWASVRIRPESNPVPNNDYVIIYEHPYSFESHSYIVSGRKSSKPVCIMNAGYSSGWCEESFGIPLTAVEVTCRAKGDQACMFIMAPPHRVAEQAKRFFGIDLGAASTAQITIPAYFERKQIEEYIRMNEEKYRRLVENLGKEYFFYRHDTDGVFTYVSPSIKEMLGFEPEEFLVNYEKTLTDNPINNAVVRHSQLSIDGIPQPPYDVEVYHKNGERRMLEVAEFPVRDKTGRIVAVEGIAHDITARKRAEDALRESERRLTDILEFFPDPTMVIDKNGRIMAWNRAMESLTRVKAQDMIGKDNYEYAIPFYGTRRPVLMDLALKPDEDFEKKYPSIERHGDIMAGEAYTPNLPGGNIYLYATAAVLRNSEGEIIGAIESIRDITDRKKTEDELRRERDFRRTLIEASPAYFVAIHSDGTTMMMNAAMLKALGYTAEQVIGRDYLTTFVPEADRPEVSKVFQELVSSREPTVSVNRIVSATGREFIVEWHGRSIFKKNGEFDYFFGIGTDITERVKIEAALRESEERFSQVVNRAVVGVFRTAPDGMALLANPAVMEIFGYDSVESFNADGGVTRLYQNQEDRQRLIAALMTGPVRGMEMPYFRRDGSSMFLAISANLVRDDKGNPLYIEGTLEDVTARKKTEEKLQHVLEELKRSNRELEDFAYVASHDLQEPIRKVLTFGDRLKTKYHDILGDEGRDYLTRMQQAASRMQNLINDLLSYSRVTTQAKPFTMVDLSALVREVIEDLEVRINPATDRIEIGPLPEIEADSRQIHQLLHNLLSNALKFRQPGEPAIIQVTGRVEGNKYCLQVADNGIGFDEKYSESIFGIFKRLHSRSEYEGTGVGLAICKKIVERHKGIIKAMSTPGKGSTFEVVLPIRQ